MAVARYLLDQNFPTPVFDVEQLDDTTKFEHLSSFAPALSKSSTPDWMVYLVAGKAGFRAIVTHDREQLDTPEALVALTCSQIGVVTWTRAVEDPVTAWAQLLAYMPQVRRRLEDPRPLVIQIPAPRLGSENVREPDRLLRARAAREKTSYPEIRSRCLREMRDELRVRRRPDLESLLS